MTGAEMVALRRKRGLSQAELARRSGIGRSAVGYWEGKATVDLRGWAPRRMAEALDLPVLTHQYARAGGRGVSPCPVSEAWIEARVAAELARLALREADRKARRRVPCGARTRKGKPCRKLSEPGKRRCKFHGGKSTGPRTPEGIERIQQAQRRRWERWRDQRGELPAQRDETRRCQPAVAGALLGQDNRE